MKRVFISIITVLLLTYAVRWILYTGVRNCKTGEYGKLNTLFLEKHDFQTLILGSSRAESHFQSRILDSVSGHSTFNAGLEGATMPFILSSLQAYLVHSSAPSEVILNIDYHAFKDNNDTIHRFPRYFPYLCNEALYKGLKERDSRFSFFKYIPFYSLPYFGDRYIDASLRGFFNKPSPFDKSFVNGYAPVPEELQQDVDTCHYLSLRSEPQAIVMESLNEIIRICKKNGSRLFLVVSPMYYKEVESVKNREKLLEEFKRISNDNKILFLDYSSHEICHNKTLFADPNHLNKKGSEVFSRQFAQDLLQYAGK